MVTVGNISADKQLKENLGPMAAGMVRQIEFTLK